MNGPSRREAADFGIRLSRIVRRMRQAIYAELRALGLSEGTWRPLAYVGFLGDGVRQKDLAATLGIEGPSLVRQLDDLERRGLIERRADEADRRGRCIHLTPPGRDLQRRVVRITAAVQARLLAGIDPADLDACNRVFAGMEAAMDDPAGLRPGEPTP